MGLKLTPIVQQSSSDCDDEPPKSDYTTNGPLPRSTFRLFGEKTTEDWKQTLYIGSSLTIAVLMFNVGFVLWAVLHNGLQHNEGIVFSGDCKTSKQISTGFHLVINILGTILLGASNYGMQCLCAPTRHDIDRAHSKGKWLDIGVQSMRNLSHIPRIKVFLWICLALSSLPLHLVYNSTIFQTLSVYQYEIFMGNKHFSSFNENNVTMLPSRGSPDATFTRLLEKDVNSELKLLNNYDCISKYATGFQTNYASLLLVTDQFNSTMGDFDNHTHCGTPQTNPYSWICHAYDSRFRGCADIVPELLANPGNWTLPGPSPEPDGYTDFKVSYCLSESVPERCTVEYSFPLILVVIVANIIKSVILWGITITMTDIPILITGDAISSFIEKPDNTTRGKCLLSCDLVIKPLNKSLRFVSKPRRWGSPVSSSRWAICLISYSKSILACIILLFIGGGANRATWAAGLGEPNTETLISGLPPSIVANTLIANIPQAVFSILYFSSNAIYTIMALAGEWSTYAVERKGLRVSMLPRGSQRSNYFLSLPYRYSIPLLVFSGILHWLMSQSLYLVSIRSYGINLAREPEGDTNTCGYSPTGIVSTLSVGVAMIGCIVLLAFKRLKSGMPVAGSCSMAISAACHPSSPAERDSELPLKWGVEISGSQSVGHCAFSSDKVEAALDRCEYV